jgi:voltage-gated sodium channel
MSSFKELNRYNTKFIWTNNVFKKIFLNEYVVLLLIIINSITIFVSGFDLGTNYNFLLSVLDNTITVLFITELMVKLNEYGKDYFKSSWNQLDFILIFFFNTHIIGIYV